MIEKMLLVVIALFPISEIALAVMKRSTGGWEQNEDRGSMRLLWLSIVVGSTLAFVAQWVPWGRFNVSRSIVVAVALALMVFGLVIRWTAIVQLGRFFTVDVAIHTDHAVVQSGLYRYVRHPSYTGLLIAFLGLGVFFGNWVSIVGLLVPIGLGVLNRINKEEQALLAGLGSPYESYCARTKRLFPGLY
jgi:protein-S-isoprenylcysteine O-methyltransferase Ste14